MSRQHAGSERTKGRRMLRLMLALTAAATPVSLSAQTDWNPIQTGRGSPQPSMELPAYPLLAADLEQAGHSSQMIPSNQMVKRWLGLVASQGGQVATAAGSSLLPGFLAASEASLPTKVLENARSKPASLDSPAFEAVSTNHINVEENNVKVANNAVVVASATEPARVPVSERLSDLDGDSSEDFQSIDPLDLMNSLDGVGQTEPDRAEEPSAVPGNPVRIQFTDPELNPPPTVQPEAWTPQPEARTPQLIRPNRGMTVSLPSDHPASSAEQQHWQETDSQVTVTGPDFEPTVLPQLSSNVSLEAVEVSSRRRPQPKAMNIQIEGVQMTPHNTIGRPPLVSLLSEVPKISSPETDSELTLKQLIYSENGRQPVVEPATSLEGNSHSSSTQTDHPSAARAPAALAAEELPHSSGEDQPEIPTSVIESKEQINLGIKKSINVKSNQQVHAVSSEHEEVCQIIQTGERTFTVIGLSEGITRIALISERDGERQIEIRQVRVSKGSTTGSDLSSIAESISQTVQQLYPSSSVRVIARGQQLVVHGKVDSEASARKILSLVRKTALVPVVDELKTY